MTQLGRATRAFPLKFRPFTVTVKVGFKKKEEHDHAAHELGRIGDVSAQVMSYESIVKSSLD